MRLLELALDAYGPFNGRRLNFDPEARIHIVLGANEAGKSSALSAIGDLFYGLPRRAEKSFLRPADMRIGATLCGRNGQMLQFFRKRGAKNTLLDASGAALPDDALAPFLGQASREVFERAFGLDAASLRAGGNDMLRNEGEIGASLFAAASGLRGLLDLRANLENQAEKIFDDRRATHRTFYQALTRYETAKAQEKSVLLSESTLKALRGEIAAADARIAAIEETGRQAQAEKLRLERLRKAAPILKNLARLRGAFTAFDDLAGFSTEWAQRLDVLLAASKEAREKAARAAQARDAARQDHQAAQVDENFLAQAERIEDLIRASGAYEKALDDLPRREAALREARQKLLFRAQACGLADLESLRAARPEPKLLLHAEKLAARGREIEAQRIEPQRGLEREQSRLAALRERQPKTLPDAAALREKLAAFGPLETWDAQARDLAVASAEETRALAERAARLSPPLGDFDHFAQNPSPDAAAIEQAARTTESFRTREQAETRRRQEASSQLAAAQKNLRALEGAGPIVSRDALRETRARRDANWRAVLAARDAGDLWAGAVNAFERDQIDADRLADLLLTDAARVAAAETEREKIAAAKADLAQADESLAALGLERAQQEDAWRLAWRPCGVTPGAPQAMIRWRENADALLDAREKAAQIKARLTAAKDRLAQVLPGLEALAAECGLEPLRLDAAAVARRIDARIADIARSEAETREFLAQLADAPLRIATLKTRLAELAEDEAKWRAEWRGILTALRLDDDCSFDEAQARIALWRAVPVELQDESDKTQRVDAIGRDIAAFEQKLDALLLLCARDLPARPALDAVTRLRQTLARAREKSALRARAAEVLGHAEAAAQREEAVAAQAEAALAELGAGDNAPSLAERLRARKARADEINAEASRLSLVADGLDEAQLALEAEAFDPDAAAIRIAEIERQARENEAQARDLHAGLRAAETELIRLQQSFGAEGAIFARESARADLADEARRWAVLKLAALLVDSGLERHRIRRKDPLIAQAGALFSGLTEGRYSGLDQDFAEGDEVHLRARRADGASLELGELSEGARDQLYLALRLAFLDDYAGRSETPPFVGDDLFASFDENRVAAGLQTLAKASGLIQPILFTHHAHVAEIAQARLGAAAQILRLD